MFNPFRALKSWYGIKRFNRVIRRMSKGGVIFRIDTNTGYQPTESVKTQPPDTISGVQSPKSGSNPNCKGIVYRSKPEGEKQKHEVYIPLETAKRLIAKKRISRLEKQIPLPAVKIEATSCLPEDKIYHIEGKMIHDLIEFIALYCPSCGFPLTTRSINEDKMCLRCRQRLERLDRVDFKEVTKDA